jgi:hypothetical protein
MKYEFSPDTHLAYKDGLLVANISPEFASDIFNYFQERKEDD